MRLILFRHGEAEPYAAQDALRQLTATGSANNLQVVSKYQEFLEPPQEILCSPYTRAQQTAADLISACPGLRFQDYELLVPDTRSTQLLAALAERIETKPVQTLMLIGHNPLLSELAGLLIDGHVDGQISRDRYLGTSNIVCLQLDVIAAGCAELEHWFKPE